MKDATLHTGIHGPLVLNTAFATFLKKCYYGRQWDFMWCNASRSHIVTGFLESHHTACVRLGSSSIGVGSRGWVVQGSTALKIYS